MPANRESLLDLLRLAGIAAGWAVAFGWKLYQAEDPRLAMKLGVAVIALATAALLLWTLRRSGRLRLDWLIELFAVPLLAGGLLYVAAEMRAVLR